MLLSVAFQPIAEQGGQGGLVAGFAAAQSRINALGYVALQFAHTPLGLFHGDAWKCAQRHAGRPAVHPPE